jgi:flagellar M-ring protein FliF
MGKEELFGESRPATASVVLKLKAGRSLPASAVNGITNLVASAVDGMKAESVVVLDNYGRPLTRPKVDENDPAGAASMERQQRLEREYAQRVVAMLEPIVGSITCASTSRWRSSARPPSRPRKRGIRTRTVIRSQQTSARRPTAAPPRWPRRRPASCPARPGALEPAGSGAERRHRGRAVDDGAGPDVAAHHRDEEQRDRRHQGAHHPAGGEIERLSVAVIVDDDQQVKTQNGKSSGDAHQAHARGAEEVRDLVASSVGFNSSAATA